MATLYDRSISIYRQSSQLVPGNAGFLGQKKANEVLLYGGIAASIQSPSVGSRRQSEDGQPYDAAGPARWNFFFPNIVAPNGSIATRDIVVDDNGDRYQVAVANRSLITWKLQCIRLEA